MYYLDFHADTLTEIIDMDETLNKNKKDLDLERVMQFSNRYVQVFSIWKNMMNINSATPDAEFIKVYDNAISLLTEQKDRINLCWSLEDMDRSFQRGKAAAFLSIEDISFMGNYAEQIKQLGFRFAMLVWNHQNQYATGSVADQTKGLTQRGIELCKHLFEQGVVVDISHLSDQGAEDLFLLTEEPVVASHSNAREVCKNPRNLTREQIQELIRREGYIGLNFFRPFVGTGEIVTTDDLLKHMDYILNLGGEDILGIGSDFDGGTGMFPISITGVQSIPLLKEEMNRAGFGETLINKILFDNGYEFLKRCLK